MRRSQESGRAGAQVPARGWVGSGEVRTIWKGGGPHTDSCQHSGGSADQGGRDEGGLVSMLPPDGKLRLKI